MRLRASSQRPVLVVIGTRPEAIKLCPVVLALRDLGVVTTICATGQHREMVSEVLNGFDLQADVCLNVLKRGQSLPALTAKLVSALGKLLEEIHPSMLIVQGDTTTTLCGAMVAFYARVPVAHVEAGLRSFDKAAPFPEEMNRVLTTRIAGLHFAPTEWAASNLRDEGIPPESIVVTGNTGIDAVMMIAAALESGKAKAEHFPITHGKKLVLVTAHRRESFGPCFEQICSAVKEIGKRSDAEVVWPVHPNPSVRKTTHRILAHADGVHLVAPVDYFSFVNLMQQSHLLLTDSGGIQEEGSSLGKPVLVLRNKTERLEGVMAGTSKLVGTDASIIVEEVSRLLEDALVYGRMATSRSVYGDGRASARVAHHVATAVRARDSGVCLPEAPSDLKRDREVSCEA
jgi:UDP-N-acetylglucosamine 2-epimerase (non-hydrolysing)